MRKVLLGLGLCLLVSSVGFSQWGGASKFGFKGFLGFSLAQTKGLSQYVDVWNGKVASNIEEYADINYKADNGIAFGGACPICSLQISALNLGVPSSLKMFPTIRPPNGPSAPPALTTANNTSLAAGENSPLSPSLSTPWAGFPGG